MLERIREGATGIWAKIILGLVILSFVFAGVGSYINSSAEISAAEVNGDIIALNTLERAYQSERGRLEAQLGDVFSQLAANGDYLKTFRDGVLQRLIDEKLMEQMAAELGLRVSNAELRQTLLEMQEFQVAGQFNNERFKAILLQAGYSPADFRSYLRTQLTRQQLSRALVLSDFSLPKEADQILRLQKQTRNARFVEVAAESFEADVEISDADRETYYLNNIASFDTEEMVKVAYVALSVDDLLGDVSVTEEDIATYYEQNQGVYRTEEERRASHILVEFGDDESASEAKINDLLAQVQAGGDFATLAEANSEDTFSAEIGGDLDWFGKGVMDQAFEDAAFALTNVGDVTDVVRSEFGFHIIKLTDLKPEQVQELAAVSAEIETTLQRELATERYLELQNDMANVAFEVPDTLDEVATIAQKDVQMTELFSRTNPPPQFSSFELLNEIFSAELIDDKVNSGVIDIDDENFIIVRVEEHQEQRTQSQEEVADQINEALTQEKSQQIALSWAKEVADLVSSDENAALERLTAKELAWTTNEDIARYSGTLNGDIRSDVFKLGEVNQVSSLELSNGNVAVVQLLAINDVTELDAAESQSNMQRLSSTQGQTSYASLVAALNDSAEIIRGDTSTSIDGNN